MRVIEKKMLHAARHGEHFKLSNTEVFSGGDVYLHGNHIATYHADASVTVNLYTLLRWPSATTQSRLRALGVPVYQKDYNVYIGETMIYDIPGDRFHYDA